MSIQFNNTLSLFHVHIMYSCNGWYDLCIMVYICDLFCYGYCDVLSDTFWTNPQYRVKVTDTDDDDDDDLGTLIVALMQKNRRKLRKEGLDMLTVGYVIYKVSADVSCSVTSCCFICLSNNAASYVMQSLTSTCL